MSENENNKFIFNDSARDTSRENLKGILDGGPKTSDRHSRKKKEKGEVGLFDHLMDNYQYGGENSVSDSRNVANIGLRAYKTSTESFMNQRDAKVYSANNKIKNHRHREHIQRQLISKEKTFARSGFLNVPSKMKNTSEVDAFRKTTY